MGQSLLKPWHRPLAELSDEGSAALTRAREVRAG